MTNRFKVQKLFWVLFIETNNFCFLSFAVWGQFQTFPDGWLGGWINRKYSHLSPQLGWGLGLSLAIRRTNSPQEFIPASQSKEKQIVTKENDIFSQKQKAEFKRFNLVQNTRQLLKEEIIHKMYPAEVLSRINEDTSLDETSTNDFISYNLQEAFLPWPLNYIHLIPDWLILTVLSILGLFLVKIFFDPAVSMLHVNKG